MPAEKLHQRISKLKSKTIKLRLVEEGDAEFILSLRLDQRYNQYLSHVCDDLNKQRAWIKQYKNSEASSTEYYFIIERHDGFKCGTVRLYDFQKESFCWGSWILNKDKTRTAAIESALLVYKLGFEELDFRKSHFHVLKGNDRVISFHTKFGAKQVSEDNESCYFIFRKETYLLKRKEFLQLSV